jgi:hypothetical protein
VRATQTTKAKESRRITISPAPLKKTFLATACPKLMPLLDTISLILQLKNELLYHAFSRHRWDFSIPRPHISHAL